MKRWIGVAVVATALFLSGCGADNTDGGVPQPEETKAPDGYNAGERGNDHQEIETYDTNVEVQSVTVDGIKCVIAVRNDVEQFEMVCP
jgi:hypothetical protein